MLKSRGGSVKKHVSGLVQRSKWILLLVATSFQFSSLAFAKVETVLGSVPLTANLNLVGDAPTTSESEIIISREQYLLSYNKTRRTPNWVAWKVTARQIGVSGRSDDFQQDTELENYLVQSASDTHAVRPSEYNGSCFDRGHQIPSDDRTDSEKDNETTFFMSNMVPQTPYLNRVVWERFEQYTRDLVQKEGKQIYVIAGPIYDADFGAIGPRKDILVPSKNFKILVIVDPKQKTPHINPSTDVVAVVMPNTFDNGHSPVPYAKNCTMALKLAPQTTDDWQQYKSSVAAIEKMAKLKIVIPHL